MSISVVVPAFDEESTIAECLAHVLGQGPVVGEVIVVDNNSTDRTADIVRRVAATDPRVRLVTEPRAGVSYARYAGFDAARNDVIASVDSDTLVGAGWAEAIEHTFADHPGIGAGGAPMTMRDLPWQKHYAVAQSRMKDAATQAAAAGTPRKLLAVSGANSALRSTAWQAVRDRVSYRRDLFEDLDLSLHLKETGHTIVMIGGMDVTVSGRRARSGPIDFLRYALCGPRTYALHRKWGMAALSAVVIVPEMARLLVMLPANRAWDHSEQRFSLRTMIRAGRGVRAAPIKSGLD